ncbi:MAG: hypothetical protein B6243_07360 [Anaerolineaceae bacterium 4572_5.2]|nr:MAG: hypothetical protein B6243_07360 [Anaerolineaceae bacterium 4572_5.2]
MKRLQTPLALIAIAALMLFTHLFTLGKFITSDEPLWATRSALFIQGLLTGNLSQTLQTGHPGVTTMWSGSAGLVLNYLFKYTNEAHFLTYIQNLPVDPLKVTPEIMHWVRIPTALMSLFYLGLMFLLTRSALGFKIALTGTMLLSLHPLFLAHSRVLHHDALASIFINLSLLILFIRLQPQFSTAQTHIGLQKSGHWRDWGLPLASGIAAGFAFLSKSTSYIMLPFVALMLLLQLIQVIRSNPSSPAKPALYWFFQAIQVGLIWIVSAVVTFSLFLPALWVDPGAVFNQIFGWVGDSAAVESVSTTVSFQWTNNRVVNLGFLFYPINWLLRTTPLTLIGLGAFVWWRINAAQDTETTRIKWWSNWLLIWIALFSIFLTLGEKRDARYLLPIYFALSLLVAVGLVKFYELLKPKLRPAAVLGFGILLLAFSLLYHPYYLAYYNPLIGGPWLAPKLTKVGWGEGMEEAAYYLNKQANAEQLRVATSYAQNFSPYFLGSTVKHHHSVTSDYVLNYIRQIQNGYPYPEYWLYYKVREPAYKLQLYGVDYLWLHQESSLARVRNALVGDDLELMGYTLAQTLIEPGDAVDVTLIWRVLNEDMKDYPAKLSLIDESGEVWGESALSSVLDPAARSGVEGVYNLKISPNAPRFNGRFQVEVFDKDGLLLAKYPFGEIPVRVASLPASATELPPTVLGSEIALAGYEISPKEINPGDTVNIVLYWRSLEPADFDYTVFVHLISSDGTVYAQHDSQPANSQIPVTQWTAGEVIADPHTLTVAANAPPGEYQLRIGMYRWDTGERLPVENDVSGQNAIIVPGATIQ